MIRRLRWKIVAINMAMVTAVLLAVFVGCWCPAGPPWSAP